MDLSSTESGVVVSAVAAGALGGCIIGAKLLDYLRPRYCLVVAGCAAALGALAAAVAGQATGMVLARLGIGIGVGLMSVATPIFVSARSDPRRRGILLTAYQLAITVGILVALSIGWVLNADQNWRAIIGLNAIPGVLLVLFAALTGADQSASTTRPTPDGPRLRGSRARRIALTPSRNVEYRAIVIAFAASLMNALTGVGLIMYYSTDIFAVASRAVAADIASFIVGAINVIATLVAVPLVAAWKRRTLLSIGLVGMSVSLAAVAAGLMVSTAGGGMVAVGGCISYIAFFAVSAGPLAWLLVAEVAPPSRQSGVTSAAVAANWIANMILAFTFPIFAGSPPEPYRVGYFCLAFAALSIFFLVFVRLVIPETKGLTLEAIQEALSGGPPTNRAPSAVRNERS